MLTADVLLTPPDLAREVRAGLEAPHRTVAFFSSHTHSGPGGFAPGWAYRSVFGPFDRRRFEAVRHAYVEAARDALDTLAPARVGHANFEIPGRSIRNRTERDGEVDRTGAVWTFDGAGGRAVWWTAGVHATTVRPVADFLSADFPGHVAERLPAGWVAFAAGGVGSAAPDRMNPESMANDLIPPLSDAIAEATSTARSDVELSLRSVVFDPPRLSVRAWGVELPSRWSAWAIDTGEFRLDWIRMNDFGVLTVPAEPSGAWSRQWRGWATARGVEASVTSLNGGYHGYVVSPQVFELPESRRGDMHRAETETLSFLGPIGFAWLFEHASHLVWGPPPCPRIDSHRPAIDDMVLGMASELAPGFLVASPTLHDPNFARSVVLLVDHRPAGSLGFVVNRPAQIPFTSVVEELGLPSPDGGPPPDIPVMVGGPVSPHTGWIVAGDTLLSDEPGTIHVTDAIRISASREQLEDLAREGNADRHLLVLGYAGWGAGQLDEEIKQGAWIPVDLDESVIFDTPFDGRWQAALQCAGLDPLTVVGLTNLSGFGPGTSN